jgi:hypothetical protein
MGGIPISSEVLGAMITPAVLISAAGVLVLSTSNRVGRTVDRVRALTSEVQRLQISSESASASVSKRKLLAEQLSQLSERAVLLRSAMTALYTAIGLLVGTSILVGIVALLQWRYSSLPLVLGFAAACALLYGSLLLVREARLAVRSTLHEVSFAREAVLHMGQQQVEAEMSLEKAQRRSDPLFYVTHVSPDRAQRVLGKIEKKARV